MIAALITLAISVALIVFVADWLDRRNDPPEGVSAEAWAKRKRGDRS